MTDDTTADRKAAALVALREAVRVCQRDPLTEEQVRAVMNALDELALLLRVDKQRVGDYYEALSGYVQTINELEDEVERLRNALTQVDAAHKSGYARGYEDAQRDAYSAGFEDGFNACQDGQGAP